MTTNFMVKIGKISEEASYRKNSVGYNMFQYAIFDHKSNMSSLNSYPYCSVTLNKNFVWGK